MTTKIVLIAIGLMVAGALLPEALGVTGIGQLTRETQVCSPVPSGATMVDGTTTAAGTTAVATERTLTGTNAGTFAAGTLCAANATPSTTATAWLSLEPAGAFSSTVGYFGAYRNIFLLGIGLGVAFLFLSWLFNAGGIRIGMGRG